MKATGNLYSKIYDMENLKRAHKNAKRGKGWYAEVKEVEHDLDGYLRRLQESLINHTYKTSPYKMFHKIEGNKEREIYKLPYYPDRICQWAILQVIEDYLLKTMTKDTYSAIPKRGAQPIVNQLRGYWKETKKDGKVVSKKWIPSVLVSDPEGTAYCLKMDVRKYYPTMVHEVLKERFRKLFKDKELIWLLDEIIDSVSTCPATEENIEILTEFGMCVNVMVDDLVILGSSKEELHKLKREIDEYLAVNMKQTIKHNWQVFPSKVRGIDFVGYRFFGEYTLLRKSTCKNFKRKMLEISAKRENNVSPTYGEWCSFNSYKGWLENCDSYRLYQKYAKPNEEYMHNYYLKEVKGNAEICKRKEYRRNGTGAGDRRLPCVC